MKAAKKALASLLSAAMLISGSSAFLIGDDPAASALAKLGLGPDTAYADELELSELGDDWYSAEVVTEKDGSEAYWFYANGVPIVIDEVDGDTVIYPDVNSNSLVDRAERDYEIVLPDSYGAPNVAAGSNTENGGAPAEDGFVTMLGGTVGKLIGANIGPAGMRSTEIGISGGTVDIISIHDAGSSAGKLSLEDAHDRSVESAYITLTGGTIKKGNKGNRR